MASTAVSAPGWFSPSVLSQGIGAGLSLYGQSKLANASEEAARLEHASTEEALADARAQRKYEQDRYADYLGRLQPYLGLGTNAGSTLQNLLKSNPYSKLANGRQQAPSMPQQYAPMVNAGAGQTPAAAAQMVTLRAPDGSQKQVPGDQAQHYIGLGAVQA